MLLSSNRQGTIRVAHSTSPLSPFLSVQLSFCHPFSPHLHPHTPPRISLLPPCSSPSNNSTSFSLVLTACMKLLCTLCFAARCLSLTEKKHIPYFPCHLFAICHSSFFQLIFRFLVFLSIFSPCYLFCWLLLFSECLRSIISGCRGLQRWQKRETIT